MKAFTRLPGALSLFGPMIAVSIMVAVALAPVVSAHSDFEGSEPVADAVLVEPLDSITLRFGTPVIGEGSSVVAVAETSGVAAQGELAADSDTNWLAVFTRISSVKATPWGANGGSCSWRFSWRAVSAKVSCCSAI